MTEEKKPEERRRRLKGKALGDLRSTMKRFERAVKGLNRKREDILDAHDAFKGQVNWNTGVIYDVDEKDAEGATPEERAKNRIPIGHISKEEEKAQRKLVREVEDIDSEIGDLKWELAGKLGCLPEDIDLSSGQIKGTPVDHIDPDAPSEEPKAEAAPADDPAPVPANA